VLICCAFLKRKRFEADRISTRRRVHPVPSKALKKLSRRALAVGLLLIETEDDIAPKLGLASEVWGFIRPKARPEFNPYRIAVVNE
jgi:hypothetical protein